MARFEKVTDAVINRATSGDGTAIVAAPGIGKSIRIVGYVIISGGTVNATWKSGSTSKSGALPLAANTGCAPPGSANDGSWQFTGGDNEAIYLNLDGAVQVSGYLTYQILPTTLVTRGSV